MGKVCSFELGLKKKQRTCQYTATWPGKKARKANFVGIARAYTATLEEVFGV
jgi:hypothetical protein